MCILAISVKVAIDSLENLTIKRIFLQNFFRVLFDIIETSIAVASWKQLNEILEIILNE